MYLAQKVNPRRLGYSPKMTAIMGAIIAHDYGARDPYGRKLVALSITSDGFVLGHTDDPDATLFLGDADELHHNIQRVLRDAKLDKVELEAFWRLYDSRVRDWRAL